MSTICIVIISYFRRYLQKKSVGLVSYHKLTYQVVDLSREYVSFQMGQYMDILRQLIPGDGKESTASRSSYHTTGDSLKCSMTNHQHYMQFPLQNIKTCTIAMSNCCETGKCLVPLWNGLTDIFSIVLKQMINADIRGTNRINNCLDPCPEHVTKSCTLCMGPNLIRNYNFNSDANPSFSPRAGDPKWSFCLLHAVAKVSLLRLIAPSMGFITWLAVRLLKWSEAYSSTIYTMGLPFTHKIRLHHTVFEFEGKGIPNLLSINPTK